MRKEEAMTIDLTHIILGIITLLAGLVIRYVIPWIKGSLDDRQYDMFVTLVRVGVYAAEQLFPHEKGKEKYEYVINLLRENGYDVDTESVKALIEATVKQLKIEIYGDDKILAVKN